MLFRSLIAPIHLPPLKPPFPKWYDENAQCSYHDGNRGHSTKNCTTLKYKVQELIKAEKVTFEDTDTSNVTANPLPNHASPKINAISEGNGFMIQKDVRKVKTPMMEVFKALVIAEIISGSKEEEGVKEIGWYCLFHQDSANHTIQDCPDFLSLVQKMIVDGEIEFCKRIEGNMVAVTQEDGQQDGTPKSLIIYYKGENQTKTTPQPSPPSIIVKVLAPFRYQNDKAVPWRYSCNVTTPGPLVIPFSSGSTSQQTVNDITGVGGKIGRAHV